MELARINFFFYVDRSMGSSFFILCPTTMNSSISKKRGSAPCAHPPLKADKILNASKVFFNVKFSL